MRNTPNDNFFPETLNGTYNVRYFY